MSVIKKLFLSVLIILAIASPALGKIETTPRLHVILNAGQMTSIFSSITPGIENTLISYAELDIQKDLWLFGEKKDFFLATGLSLLFGEYPSASNYYKRSGAGFGCEAYYADYFLLFGIGATFWVFNNYYQNLAYTSYAVDAEISAPLALLGINTTSAVCTGIGLEMADINGWKSSFYAKVALNYSFAF